jgi:iron-sulfur cluster repair protein YtfE (RIC family)
MVSHFRREEETVFPLLVEADGEDRALLVEALLDHQRLHALGARLADELDADAVSSELLNETGSQLESHVRLEERRLFPLVEQLAGERLTKLAPAPEQDSPVVDQGLPAPDRSWAARLALSICPLEAARAADRIPGRDRLTTHRFSFGQGQNG